MSENIYEAPNAWGADPVPHGSVGSFSPVPHRRPAGAGVDWLRTAWHLFMRSPGLWIGTFIVWIGLSIAVQLIPVLGPIAQNLLGPVIVGGLMLGCHALAQGDALRFEHLWAGFNRNPGQLLLLAVLNFFLGGMIVLVAVLAFFGLVGTTMPTLPPGSELTLDIVLAWSFPVLLALFLIVPLSMANWFAIALIAINDLPAIEAMKASLFGCLTNLSAFLVYGVLALGIALLATVPLGLGWFVAAPVFLASSYSSYRDVFYADTSASRRPA